MGINEQNELTRNVDELRQVREALEKDINDLNKEKIAKIESINDELEKRAEWLDKERIKAIRERDNIVRKTRQTNEKTWKNALKMISVLVLLDLVIVPILINLLGISLQWIFVSIGLLTFFGVMLMVNYMSGTSPLNTGEVRKALTVSIITVYFAFVPLVTFGAVKLPQSFSTPDMITNFTWIIGAIIVLYFTTRTVEAYIDAQADKAERD